MFSKNNLYNNHYNDNNNSRNKMIEKHSFKFVLSTNNNSLVDPELKLNFSQTRWQEECLEKIRTELNCCKSKLSNFPLHLWEKHTEHIELSSNIKKVILQKFSNKPPVITINCFNLVFIFFS